MLELAEVGKRVQSLRKARGLTLQELAVAASVSVSMLSSVERGQKAATILVLDRIADGLGVPLGGLITSKGDRVIVRRAAGQDAIDEPGGLHRVILSPVVPGVNFEWIRSALPPGCDAGQYPAYAGGSHEYVVVESGTLRLTIGDEDFTLDAGDSVYFAADVSHGYANTTSIPCTYYVAALIMRAREPSLPRGTGRAGGAVLKVEAASRPVPGHVRRSGSA
jgi:XRE family transcriptional regulator, regulator of sulfur utilization